MIDEHREMERRLIEAGELQGRVFGRSFAIVTAQSLFVAAFKLGSHGAAPGRFIDPDKAPGLAVAYGWRETGGIEKPVKSAGFQGLRAETPYIATPAEQFQKLVAKILGEFSRHGRDAVLFRTT